MKQITDYFGCMVFSDKVMQKSLSKEVYQSLKDTIKDGKQLDISVANSVANAMKDWAISLGATHYTHWFQPMTGMTAEKHDSFISYDQNYEAILKFNGKQLIKGEPDASSFPSGGLRSTYEARGYTAWDPTSFAFIKDKVLCIPTAFCSYSGEALDKKTPLLKSMQAVNKQVMRILALFKQTDVYSVKTEVGPEQEYFLIDRDVYQKRKDLVYTGRTLFGAPAPKGQELGDHYFGVIKPRVRAFMEELDEELWKIGVYAKTEHNEVAPSQFELAPIYSTANIAADNNQITMEFLQKIAKKHNLVCLLHEKPFKYINGSGKHNNWSISTNLGKNLFEPGETPKENAQFLLFLCAVIKAVDEYQDLIRIGVATRSNDLRLGGDEAPPAIMSIFLGEELEDVLESIENDTPLHYKGGKSLKIGVDVLPKLPRDTTDRNRTSPIAFTGNKFEFRAVGSSDSISSINTMINTAMAEELMEFADILEKAEDFNLELNNLIKKTIKEHKRIIFNGNGYGEEWVEEAKRRGLLNLPTTPDALPYLLKEKNIKLFVKHGIYTENELRARYEIANEHYCKIVNIEALTALDMINKGYLPAISSYTKKLADSLSSKKEQGVDTTYELYTLVKVSNDLKNVFEDKLRFEELLKERSKITKSDELAYFYRDNIIPMMVHLRELIDGIEMVFDENLWPFPSYGELLYSL